MLALNPLNHTSQGTTELFYNRPRYEHSESKQLYLIHRNKHREAAKVRRQKYGSTERTEQNSREGTKQNGHKQSIGCRVQNTIVITMLKQLTGNFNSIKKT